mmetsp:Transcript_104172/g.190846  ORF Transcript_104172/g.190846 Transcript_104172/m.190846 type:complete len:348 (-) Transcript_104172:32-1075(-)
MTAACREADAEGQPLLAPAQSASDQLAVVLWVLAWMVFSSSQVIFNKWMFEFGGFPYPLAMTSLHMFACFMIFGTVRRCAPSSIRLTVMPAADVVIPWPIYFKHVIAISLLYSMTLGAGNLAYLCSTVAFIQMLKPMNVIVTSVCAIALGMEAPTGTHMIIVCIISFGVFVATFTAAQFSLRGACLQVFATLCEGLRLVLMQSLTSAGLRLDPVTTVYHVSFASSVALAVASIALEKPTDPSTVNTRMLALNCFIAVFLNVLIATVIKKTSAVVFTLSGIIKDIGIISASNVMFHSSVGLLQAYGYAMAVFGLCMYKAYKDNIEYFKSHGFSKGFSRAAFKLLNRAH